MSAPTKPATSYRLVVPVPVQGWLTLLLPEEADQRIGRAYVLSESAWRCIAAAHLPELGPVHAVVTFRPQRQGYGLHVAEDLRPSWHPVRDALKRSGINCRTEELHLGAPTGDLEPLMTVELRRVPDVR